MNLKIFAETNLFNAGTSFFKQLNIRLNSSSTSSLPLKSILKDKFKSQEIYDLLDKKQAQELIKETFENSFDKSGFTNFIKNLFNRIDDAPFIYQGNYIPDAYKQYIKKLLGQIIFLYFLQKKGNSRNLPILMQGKGFV